MESYVYKGLCGECGQEALAILTTNIPYDGPEMRLKCHNRGQHETGTSEYVWLVLDSHIEEGH